MTRFFVVTCCMLLSLLSSAQPFSSDSIKVGHTARPRHWGYEAEVQAGQALKLDKYQKAYMGGTSDYSLAFKFNHVSLPTDSDAYAYDYHYPTFSIVGKFSKNNGVTMHRDEDYPRWDNLSQDYYDIAPYNTRLGNSFAIYGSFSYPLYRHAHWEFDACVNLGLAYSTRKYDKQTNADNDMIGSRILFYAGGSVNATYRVASSLGIKAGIDYWHISNGSTRQPNRSANILGPTLGVVYYPYYDILHKQRHAYIPPKFQKYWYLNFKGGVGAQTRIEDWDRTQYDLTKDHPEWRKEDFTLYSVASLQADIMYRYARIGALGAGLDLQYCSCYSHIRDIDVENGESCAHSPWAIAFDLKHTFFYGNVSLALGGGVYLYREMGAFSNRNDSFFFNRIGVHYTIPKLHNLTAGIEVKAHLTKADFAELVVSYPLRLGKGEK